MSQDFRLKLSRNYERKLARDHIEVLKGQKMINSVTYRIPLEDHTVGDLLRIYLLKNNEVKFAGYRVPHPLDDMVEVKVQTASEDTNKIVKETLKKLQIDLFQLENEFETVAFERLRELN
jgi:DNA-directed RNA polymerase II subunit RPB11